VWGLATKFSEMLGLAATGWVLELAGYAPNVAQSSDTLRWIRLFFGPIPLVLLLIAVPLLVWFPITRAKHAEMLSQLAEGG
jgi:GPH family glycoside/pentoside/hexuronide:cation symporter